jgi:hypothetical protein
VPLGGGNEPVVLVGGVCDLPPDRMVPLSVGDKRCERAWGTESSNISWRNTAEYVLLASSAGHRLAPLDTAELWVCAYSSGSGARYVVCASTLKVSLVSHRRAAD